MEDPKFWFTQADPVFHGARITSSLIIYDHCLAKLPAEAISSIC
jgi:hypothetical protein